MNNLRFARIALVALACLSPQWATAQPSSANYKLPISLLNSGVDSVTSTNFKLSSSLGDGYFTGPSTSPNFKMQHGLWTSVGGGGAAPVLASVVSRKVHGIVGSFDLLLVATPPSPTIQPQQGPAQTIVFTFDNPVADAGATVTTGTATEER